MADAFAALGNGIRCCIGYVLESSSTSLFLSSSSTQCWSIKRREWVIMKLFCDGLYEFPPILTESAHSVSYLQMELGVDYDEETRVGTNSVISNVFLKGFMTCGIQVIGKDSTSFSCRGYRKGTDACKYIGYYIIRFKHSNQSLMLRMEP